MQYENVIFPDSMGFRCRNCGFCCRDQPSDISLKEQQRIEAKGFVNFLEDPDDAGNRNIRRNEDGSCFFLTKENICKIQDIKPAICMLEPFIITDYDYETKRISLDLNPLAVKTCKGIFSGEMTASKEIGQAAQAIVNEFLEIVAQKMGLQITDEKVATLTKKLLTNLNCAENEKNRNRHKSSEKR
jgi:Fe-S-cluster containining protein